MNGYAKCSTHIKWNTIQPEKGMKLWYRLQHEPWKHYALWNKPNIKQRTLYHYIYMKSRIGKFIETESRLEVTWGEGEKRVINR